MNDYVSLNRVNLHISRKREIMAGVALLVSLWGFVFQTEVLGYVSSLGYKKPIFVMYLTHSCMVILLPLQTLVLWFLSWYKRGDNLITFYEKHSLQLKHTAIRVAENNNYSVSKIKSYAIYTSVILASALNLAGASWYVAIGMTTTADLTAIYNCSTFFAYGFSIWILKEKINNLKVLSVFVSIIGVFIIAYSGSSQGSNDQVIWHDRITGNIIIALGSILYGLYEVLYKKIACPPQTVSARKQASFANLVGASIGLGTFILMWPVLFILHWSGMETFELPSAKVAMYILLSIVGNVAFSGAFLVLMSLTSPVLGSVSSLLATCTVPLVNFIIWHQSIGLVEMSGGLLIIVAFGILTMASLDDFVEEKEAEEEGQCASRAPSAS